MPITSPNIGRFSKFFHYSVGNLYTNTPPQPKRVATLPCEISMFKHRHVEVVIEANCHVRLNHSNKKLSYRRETARCVVSIEILPIATQQCRNYLYDNSWPNRWYEVGDLVGGNAWQTMCTQPWRDRVGSHCLRCHKQTHDGRIVYVTCLPTTCCGEIF